jgi:hypothetical protein
MALPKQKGIDRIKKRIVPIEEAEEHLKILLYARNGQGKTRTACTCKKPALLLDMNEKGTRSARHQKGVDVLPIKNWADITYAYWYLREGNHEYVTVILDTLTGMQQICIKQILKEGEDRDPNKDPKTMSQRDWGKLAELMKGMLLDFRNLPLHVIFTAQERTVDDPETESRERVPDLSPGSRATATACVDVIGRVYQREVRKVVGKKEKKDWETRMLVGPSDEYITKDRTGALGRIVQNPNIEEIMAKAGMEE